MALTFVVTGASRGLGVEFVKQLSAKGHTVIACARNPDKSEQLQALVNNKTVFAVSLDTVKLDSVKAAADKIQELAPSGVDVLINNSGIVGDHTQDVTNATGENYINVFETNVVGTSNVTQALLPWLRKRNTRKIVNITSILGSNDFTTTGSSPAYRISKAAENMLSRGWAGQLGEESFVVLAMHPGWVQTDMGTSKAPVTPEQSISGMLSVIENMSKETNGKFLSFEGEELKW
ncbi:4-dihydrotrisporin dehydrogenase [Zychaea mexicana]|uniref:4-dihydrotrisporin dehydrogenase n=1 Tax=Zychaea mexicana TaxID=64656 RepID=UPI0022FE7386|nr:4-dihydrotrisporin dehydrogenase [Zychaea mexicana]KAI9488072.1 4-dihydrotrisporin dehydrogenase [Zychaea mexicana]